MTTDSISILCTGDLHLGRHPTRIPAELDGEPFSPKRVWRSTVDFAINQDVDALLISGDIIDRENQFIEAYGPFEDGATRLDEAGIPTLVVTGNHDFDVLPRLVSNLDLDHLTLLGADETWERWTYTDNGANRFHVDAWSFAREHVHKSPLETYDLDQTEAPVVGLLHADYGVPESDYAPVERAALEATPADAWLLGHIHAPGIRVEQDPLVFYPGSPQPLDPGEPGEHGPWLLELPSSGSLSVEPVPQATVRYDELEVDASEVTDWKDLPPLAREEIDSHLSTAVNGRDLELLSVRLILTGRTNAHGELVAHRESLENDLQFKSDTISIRIDDVEVETQPAIDLEEEAKEDTPLGHLAELLLSIDAGEVQDTHPDLSTAAMDAVQEAYSSGTYTPLRRDGRITDPDREESIDVLRQQTRLLIHELDEQRRRNSD